MIKLFFYEVIFICKVIISYDFIRNYNLTISYEAIRFHDFIKNYNFIISYEAIRFHHLVRKYNFILNRELIECSSLLKCDEVVDFANIPQANKAVSKKFGDVKKISLFERSEFEIFSRRAFCVLMGRAPARTMGIRGRFKEGERGLARPLYPLLIRNVKASAF